MAFSFSPVQLFLVSFRAPKFWWILHQYTTNYNMLCSHIILGEKTKQKHFALFYSLICGGVGVGGEVDSVHLLEYNLMVGKFILHYICPHSKLISTY